MGIVERKEREKLELRELILKTAARQFSENGFEKTSMRSIAKEIEYSPTTIYLYFKDKSALLFALSQRAFTEFYRYLEVSFKHEHPLDRLRDMGENYFRFAMENPDYYDLMFILSSPMESLHSDDRWDSGIASHELLTNTVKECMELGHFKGKDPDVMSFMIWSFVHGVMAMHIRKRMMMYPEEKREWYIHQSLETFNEIFLEEK